MSARTTSPLSRRIARAGAVAAMFGALAGQPAGAELLLDGGEFAVNTYTTDDQFALASRSVVVAPDGSFVVIWQSYGSSGTDTDQESVQGQRFDSAGVTVGTEFQVNSYTTGDQSIPSVTSHGTGFVVVWHSDGSPGTDTDSQSVHARRYDATGAPLAPPFQVNTYTTGSQSFASVAEVSGGGFVVVWGSDGSVGADTSYSSILGRLHDASGAPVGAEFEVNSYTTNTQLIPTAAALAGGGFVVTWSGLLPGSDTDGSLIARRFDSAASPLGTDFQVNTYTTYTPGFAAVGAFSDGGFIVTWAASLTDDDDPSVYAQRFDSTGATAGTELTVNTIAAGAHRFPSVAVAADDGFVIAHDSEGSAGTDSSYASIQARRYDSNASPVGTEFQVNTFTTGNQYVPTIVTGAVNDFLVLWASEGQDGSGFGLTAQPLCADDDTNGFCDNQPTTTTTSTTTTTTLPTSCSASPLAGCTTGLKSSIQIRDNADPGKRGIKWKLSRGDAVVQADLGDPTTTTEYSLCVYDETGDVASLATSLQVDPGPAWDDRDPKGFKHKDKTGTPQGVQQVQMKTGESGKTKAQVKAKGANTVMPVPISPLEYFDLDSRVTVQLIASDVAHCWTTEFTAAKKNDGSQFKAKSP